MVLDPVGARLDPGAPRGAVDRPGWTPLFLTAGGLVMEMGGANSHGAVVAREYGIPAVVGVAGATDVLRTGDTITIDGAAGTVTRDHHDRIDHPLRPDGPWRPALGGRAPSSVPFVAVGPSSVPPPGRTSSSTLLVNPVLVDRRRECRRSGGWAQPRPEAPQGIQPAVPSRASPASASTVVATPTSSGRRPL